MVQYPKKMTAHHHFPLFDSYNWGLNPSFSDSHPAGGWSASWWNSAHRDWRRTGFFFTETGVENCWDVLRKFECPFSSYEKALHCKTVLCPLCSNGFKWVDQKLICNPSVHTKLIWILSHSGFTCFNPSPCQPVSGWWKTTFFFQWSTPTFSVGS